MTTPKCVTCGDTGEVVILQREGCYWWPEPMPCPDCALRITEPPPPTDEEIELAWAEMLGQENPR